MNKSKSRKYQKQKNNNLKKYSNIKKIMIGLIALLCVCGLLPEFISGRLLGNSPDNADFQSAYVAVSEAVSDVLSGNIPNSPKAPGSGRFEDIPSVTDPSERSGLRVDFLDVGQGLSVLINADGRFMLYDGGDRTASSFVVAYLKEKGVAKLDYMVASHYDADHLNGLVGALNVFNTDMILGPGYETDTKIYKSFTDTVQRMKKEVVHPQPGERYPLGGGYFEILSPLSAQYDDVNNYSIAIRLVYGDTSSLLAGDAEQESEQEMTEYWPDLKADVLCVGHHGSPTSTGEAFLDSVNPSIAVISCGRDNSYGHPGKAVLERLDSRNITVVRTDESGTITLTSDGSALTLPAS